MRWEFVLFFFMGSLAICGKNVREAGDSVTISGHVKNALNGSIIESACITCVSNDSILSGHYVSFVRDLSNEPHLWHEYAYEFKVPKSGKYSLYIESEGFEKDSITIEIPERQYGRRVREWEMEDIFLIPKRKAENLGTAVVRATRVIVVMKGDTLVYNASAFKLAEGSMLDALIARLPGAKIDENGQIFINGKYVNSLLLNGKDFFKGQAHVVLKNLPAYTVNKIKFYQKEADDAYLVKRNHYDRQEDPWVLDVQLKREYSTGWLVNAEAGFGSKHRYIGRAFALRFTDVSRLITYVGINNLNNSSTADLDGTWDSFEKNVGRIVNKAGGIDYLKENPLRHSQFRLHLSGTHQSYSLEEYSNQTLYLLNPNVYKRTFSQSQDANSNINAYAQLQYRMKKMFLFMKLESSYERQNNKSFSREASFDAPPEEYSWGGALDSLYEGSHAYKSRNSFISRLQDLNTIKRDTWSFNYFLNSSIVSPFTGKKIGLKINAQHSNSCATGRNAYDYENEGINTNLLQKRPAHARTSKLETTMSYELLSKNKFLIELIYNFFYGYTNDRLSIFALQTDTNFISATDWAIATTEVLQPNSYRTSIQNVEHEPLLKLYWRLSPKMVVNMSYPVRFIHEKINDSRYAFYQTKRRNYATFEPNINVSIIGIGELNYHISNRAAPIKNLLDINDDTQPLVNRLGNSMLKRPVSHQIMFWWQSMLGKNQRMMNVSYWYNIYVNKVSMGLSYDHLSGVSTIKPDNVNGNWDMSLRFSLSQALDKAQRLRATIGLGGKYINSVELINNDMSAEPKRSSVRNFEPDISGRINYSLNKLNLALRASTSWHHITNTSNADNNINAWKYQVGLSAQCPLPLKLTLNSDLSLRGRRGYSFSEMNTDDFVLNGSLSRAFGKKDEFIVKLYAEDILGSRKNVSTIVNAQGLTEKWQNTLPRNVMLSLMWNFHK